MKEATAELELTVKGKKVKVAKEDHYFTEDGNSPVIKHGPLVKLAEKHGVRVDEVKLEFAFPTDNGLYVAHRAFGKDENGNVVSTLGEAGPNSLDSDIAARYPAIMSDKRAQDRLLIKLLGLEGQLYSEFEISKSSASAPDPAQNVAPADVVFPFGKHKGKTLSEIAVEDRKYLEWLTTKYEVKTSRDEALVKAAVEVLAA